MFQAKSNLTRITQRQVARFGNGGDPREARKPIEQLFLDNISLECIGITHVVEYRANNEGILRVEPEGRIEQTRKAAQQEASCNQQHKSDGDFSGRNGILQPLTAAV